MPERSLSWNSPNIIHKTMNSLAQVRAAELRKSFRARILLVDDDKMLRELFSSALCETGYEVETASDGADALQRIEVEDFDLVVTDWQMPVLDRSEEHTSELQS